MFTKIWGEILITINDIIKAQSTLKPIIRRTDIIPASNISGGNEIYLKTENLQTTGSFKIRGAYNKISSLTDAEKEKGVIACSAGNHAQGVALAATKEGIRSLICIPSCAPISKIEKTKKYGAEVCIVDGVYDDAYEKACGLQKESGATFIHPFNDDKVIAGQGTIGAEILEQLRDTDAVIVPVGGGGLISGVAFTIKSLKPECKVYGVQASGAAGMLNSLRKNKIESLERVSTFADGIAVKCPGSLTYDYCKKYVDDIVPVSDNEIATAILELIEKQKIVAEGAGAASVAAAMFGKVNLHGKKTVCLVSGGNIDVTILSRVINRGLIEEGRFGQIFIDMADRPGQVMEIASIVAKLGGNIMSIHHDRNTGSTSINDCQLSVCIETKDAVQFKAICTAIEKAGYNLHNK